jgi:putative hydrolase of the HAD superfamily
MVRAIIFDFGGVLAEEGFREGLKAIAVRNRLDPEEFFRVASDLIYKTGYVTGAAGETVYLDRLRKETGIRESNGMIKGEILRRFIIRPDVIGYVEKLRAEGLVTAILSDQTNWLDELNGKDPFFHHFDYVFNSFRIGKGKRDPSVFEDICLKMGLKPQETVFVDDSIGNVKRAACAGLSAVLYTELGELKEEMKKYFDVGHQRGFHG